MFLGVDATFLARIQFAFTVAFHIVFPAFTIGLSSYIATLEGVWFFSGDDRFQRLARHWTKIFAVSFAMGVVSGVPMSYQFGTNWSQFSIATGNVIGPLLGYEVLMAFFLESSFLGVMLFGWNRVPPWLHFFASLMVAAGTLLSAFWILAANSWMQYPAGHEVRDGIAYPVDWLQVIFSPTFPMALRAYGGCRLSHDFGRGAGRWGPLPARGPLSRRGADHDPHGARFGAGAGPRQLVVGDLHGLDTAQYQPAKLAAIEAHWDGTKPADLVFFAIPDEAKSRNDYELGIPKLGAFVITRDWNGLYKGLNDFAPADRPPLWPPFFAFRLMVAIGAFLILLAFYGGIQWLRGRLFESRLFLWPAAFSWPLGFIAVLSGWTVTEVGPPALACHGHRQDRGRGFAAGGWNRGCNRDPFRPGVSRRLLRRHLLHEPADPPGANARGRDSIRGGQGACAAPAHLGGDRDRQRPNLRGGGELVFMPLNRSAQHYRHSPHPVPLPMGEGTPEQRAQRDSLSSCIRLRMQPRGDASSPRRAGERVGVRGVTVVLGAASGD